MNKYFKEFMHRGLMFSGLGPIVFGIVILCISYSEALALTGKEVLMGIISTYAIAFIQAGATVFNQIEHWSLPKSMLCHFSMLYAVYSLAYIANSWIPFKAEVLLIFTVIFVVVYFAVWGIVYLAVRNAGEKFNAKLNS